MIYIYIWYISCRRNLFREICCALCSHVRDASCLPPKVESWCPMAALNCLHPFIVLHRGLALFEFVIVNMCKILQGSRVAFHDGARCLKMHGKISLEQCNAGAGLPRKCMRLPIYSGSPPGLLAQSQPLDHSTARPDRTEKALCNFEGSALGIPPWGLDT